MTIKEKILTFLSAQGIKKTEFFDALGLSPSNFKGVAKQAELGGDKIAKILTMLPTMSAEWLMRGVGPMVLDEVNSLTEKDEILTPSQEDNTSSPSTPDFIVDRLLNKIDEANSLSRSIAEENGRLKERVEQLERELAEARAATPQDAGPEYGESFKQKELSTI